MRGRTSEEVYSTLSLNRIELNNKSNRPASPQSHVVRSSTPVDFTHTPLPHPYLFFPVPLNKFKANDIDVGEGFNLVVTR